MQTRFSGAVHRFGDGVDTDMITPGKYLAILDPKELGKHCLEGADAGFAARVKPGDLILAGANFGCGSSREHAPVAIKACGVPVVVAESFARIFYRNAINLGLPLLEVCGVAKAFQPGDAAEVDLAAGTIRNARTGQTLKGPPLSAKALEILEAGGLVEIVKRKLAARAGGKPVKAAPAPPAKSASATATATATSPANAPAAAPATAPAKPAKPAAAAGKPAKRGAKSEEE